MDDVKDTLWKWAVQIAALASWGWELWGISAWAREIAGKPGSELIPEEAVGILIGVMMLFASVFYLRLLSMRKWAGWTKAATSSAHVYRAVAMSELGLSHWATQLNLGVAIVLLAALLLRPKVWRGGL